MWPKACGQLGSDMFQWLSSIRRDKKSTKGRRWVSFEPRRVLSLNLTECFSHLKPAAGPSLTRHKKVPGPEVRNRRTAGTRIRWDTKTWSIGSEFFCIRWIFEQCVGEPPALTLTIAFNVRLFRKRRDFINNQIKCLVLKSFFKLQQSWSTSLNMLSCEKTRREPIEFGSDVWHRIEKLKQLEVEIDNFPSPRVGVIVGATLATWLLWATATVRVPVRCRSSGPWNFFIFF